MRVNLDEIRTRIREVRLKLQMTQAEFATEMGVNQKTWSNIEIGVNPVADRYVNLICLTFNIRKEWLLGGQGNMFVPSPKIPQISQNHVPEFLPTDNKETLPPELIELIAIYKELVPLNQKAVLDFVETTLQSQRNTIKALNNRLDSEKKEQSG